jgi:hypothetical protein
MINAQCSMVPLLIAMLSPPKWALGGRFDEWVLQNAQKPAF